MALNLPYSEVAIDNAPFDLVLTDTLVLKEQVELLETRIIKEALRRTIRRRPFV